MVILCLLADLSLQIHKGVSWLLGVAIQQPVVQGNMLVHHTGGIPLAMVKKNEILHNTGGIRACEPHWRNTIVSGEEICAC